MGHLSVGKGKYREKVFHEELFQAVHPGCIPNPGSMRMMPAAPLRPNPCPCQAWGRRDGDPIMVTLQAATGSMGLGAAGACPGPAPGPWLYFQCQVEDPAYAMRKPIPPSHHPLSHIPAPSCSSTLPSPAQLLCYLQPCQYGTDRLPSQPQTNICLSVSRFHPPGLLPTTVHQPLVLQGRHQQAAWARGDGLGLGRGTRWQ